MLARLTRLSSVLLFAVPIFGCEHLDGRTKEAKNLNAGQSMLLSADIRTVSKMSRDGKVVTCAEPSPDVVRAISQSKNFGGSLTVSGLPAGIEPEVALAISQAQAGSAAQLGERLATIQLLRDGLYRACEAYANGAISKTAYAVMLGRFDDTMITMLLGEIAGGAFGRSLATLGGTATGSAEASLETQETLKEAETLAENLKDAREATDLAQAEMQAASAGDDEDRKRTAKKNLETNRQAERNLEEQLSNKLETAANSAAAATAVAAGSITPGQQSTEIAKTLHDMQRKYMENINFDAVEVACVSALEHGDESDFAKLCKEKVLGDIQSHKKDLLHLILMRAWTQLDNERAANNLDAVKDEQKILDGINNRNPTESPEVASTD